MSVEIVDEKKLDQLSDGATHQDPQIIEDDARTNVTRKSQIVSLNNSNFAS